MIYEHPGMPDPIRQGDIFVALPRPDVSLDMVAFAAPSGDMMEASWEELAVQGKPIEATVSLTPVAAIVITQDCDAVRSPHVSLCEIQEFRQVERKAKDTTAPNSWRKIITQQARLNQKWFYLPPSDELGWNSKMAVDFRLTLRLPRDGLEGFRRFRRARLNELARAHFRERVADFFRRYPYDEWYALSSEELAAYRKDYPDAEPFDWQHAGEQS